MKPYPKYKDSGIEWIGEIPEHWNFFRLKHMAKVTLSGVDKKSEDGEQPVKLCNYTDVYYNEYITDSIEFMDATASQSEIDYATLHEGDVLITKDSETPDDIAIPAFVKSDLKNVLCGYHLAQLRPRAGTTHGEFLFRLFCANTLREQFTPRANGITRYGIGKYNIDNSIFPLPSYLEQTPIATYLDLKTKQIEKQIENEKDSIERLKEYRTALISNAVTGKIDVRDIIPS
jgi:type I restriction enzyme S subunit